MDASIKVRAELKGVNAESIYPEPGTDPNSVDWLNLPQRWYASFKLEGGGYMNIGMPSLEAANSLSLNTKYTLTITSDE